MELKGGRTKDPTAHSKTTQWRRRKEAALSDVPLLNQLPMIPAFLIPEAVEVWNRTGAELVERGILTDLDIGLLATYCQAVGHSMRIEQQIAALEAETPGSGYITQTRAGATIHPLQNLSQKYLQTIRLLSVELGLTPGGRTKIAKPKEPEAPHSDLDAYLKRISERKAGPHDNAV